MRISLLGEWRRERRLRLFAERASAEIKDEVLADFNHPKTLRRGPIVVKLIDLTVGFGAFAERDQRSLAVFPQARVRWVVPAMEALAMATLDAAIAEFHGDATRIYLMEYPSCVPVPGEVRRGEPVPNRLNGHAQEITRSRVKMGA